MHVLIFQVDYTNMHEPVAETCVTIVPKFKEYPDVSGEETHTKEIKNNDNRIKANVIPEKPPRRIKLQKLRQHTTINDENETKTNLFSDNTKNIQNNTKPEEYKVDLDDVNRLTIECEKNFKNVKYVSVSVQATPNPPYRLRIWPKRWRRIKSDPEKCDFTRDAIGNCCVATSRWIFSQCGLTVIIIIWALLGAAAFHETEGNYINVQKST